MAKGFPNVGATVIDAAADLPAASAALEGVMMFQKDTNELKICDGSSWISMLDTDNKPMDAWTAYTPSWVGTSSNPSIGNGVLSGRYLILGKTAFMSVVIAPGSTTTFGSGYYGVSPPTGFLPFKSTPGGTNYQIVTSSALLTNPGVASYIFTGAIFGGTPSGSWNNITPLVPSSLWWSTTSPLTFANGHIFHMTCCYEIA